MSINVGLSTIISKLLKGMDKYMRGLRILNTVVRAQSAIPVIKRIQGFRDKIFLKKVLTRNIKVSQKKQRTGIKDLKVLSIQCA